ncbi:hypothetical protein [Elongatibacter sediminis]|uniref:Uncharacterized protein n=1 Tax=Elongatibacter sediminis TaxID=3119006 RepID=A0AAW9RFV8_9GAMM
MNPSTFDHASHPQPAPSSGPASALTPAQTAAERSTRTRSGRILSALMACLTPAIAAASAGLHIPPDTNSRVLLLNARPAGDTTRVLYATYPDRGDARFGERCAVAAHVATVPPALEPVAAETVSTNLCDMLGLSGTLLANGEAVLVNADGIGRWRDGGSPEWLNFSALPALRGVEVDPANAGHRIDINRNGELLVAWVDYSGAGGRDADTTVRAVRTASVAGLPGPESWRAESSQPGIRLSLLGAWIGEAGGALTHINQAPNDGSSIALNEALVPFDAGGQAGEPIVIAADRQPTLEQQTAVGGDLQKLQALLKDSYSESIRQLTTRARAGGGFDVLFDRSSGKDSHEGHFLLRIGPDGAVTAEHNLTAAIVPHGLDDWKDFRIDRDALILLSRVSATQAGITGRRSQYPQNVVSWIPLAGGAPVSRLLPLNRQYLQAVMAARDEELQNLADRPGGPPLALSVLNGQPLAISETYRSRRFALQFDTAADDLPQYTEAYDDLQAKQAKAQARAARKADREARSEAMNAKLAEASGMSPEEFAQLSNRERKEQMLRHGDMDAIMAAAMEQMAAVQQAMGANGQAAAGMSPEAAAAMQQAMAAMAQGMAPGMAGNAAASGNAVAGTATATPGANTAGTAAADENRLEVGANGRAFIEYDSPDGQPLTLLIEDRNDNRELLRRLYADGSIYENIDFNTFGVPLERIAVKYVDASGATLRDLTPHRAGR